MELDLRTVRAFVAVADARHFGEAADRLGLTQQAVSKRLAKLEAQLGTSLLRRSGRERTGLTEDGATFLAHARALLAVADQAGEALLRRHRPLRIDVLGHRLAATELVHGFYQGADGVEVELVTSHGLRDARAALAGRTVDAAFARVMGVLDPSIEHAPALLEPLHMIVGRRHPLAGRRTVTAAQASGYTAWMPFNQPGSEWADYYAELESELGIRFDTGGPNFGLERVLERLGDDRERFIFGGERMRVPWHPAIVRIPIVDPTPAYPWSLLWNRHRPHPALPLLIRHVEAGFTELDPARQWVPAADRARFSNRSARHAGRPPLSSRA